MTDDRIEACEAAMAAAHTLREKMTIKFWFMLEWEGGWTPEKVQDKKLFNSKTFRWGGISDKIKKIDSLNDQEFLELFWATTRRFFSCMG